MWRPCPSKEVSGESRRSNPRRCRTGRLEQEQQGFKHRVHNALLQRLSLSRQELISLPDQELRRRAEEAVLAILAQFRWNIPQGLKKDKVVQEILDEALGLGPLEELLADESVSEIMVNRYDQIYVERSGRIQLSGLKFSNEQAVLHAIERIISPIGRRIDESSPLVDARLKDGSRVNAAIRPVALDGPCITIRKFSKDPITMEDLVRFGSLTQAMSDFLRVVVVERKNLIISGGTGSGKTTLLNTLARFIPGGQRIITIEDAAELQLPQDHVVKFESRPPNIEGKGAIDISYLIRNALRMRPDRIIIGECRGGEALGMLQAMNTGHAGSMTTGHANTPADMISRLETMVLMAGMELPVRAIREQIASALEIIVQQTRFVCGTRRITAVSEIVGIDPDQGNVLIEDIYRFVPSGLDEQGRVKGRHQATGYVPKFVRLMQEEGKSVDPNIFAPED